MNTMKKTLLVVFAAAGVAGAAHADTLRVGMECTYAPFNFRTADGVLTGYDVDVALGVTERMGVEVEFVCQQWDGMIPALLAERFDLIVASMSITEQRREVIDFSIPYRVSIGRFLGRTDREFNLFEDDGTPILENFDGLRIGVERATTYNNWIDDKLPDTNYLLYDGAEAMLLDLRNGRVDIAVTNPMKAYLDFLSQAEGEAFEFVSPALDSVEYFGIGVGIGLRKGQDELLEQINTALAEMIEDGTLTEYSHRYFPFAINPEEWGDVPSN